MKTKLVPTSAAEQAARDAAIAAIRPYADELGSDRMLAVLAYTVGQLLAFQDQRTMTPAKAMALISSNIEQGNADAIAHTLGKPEGNA